VRHFVEQFGQKDTQSNNGVGLMAPQRPLLLNNFSELTKLAFNQTGLPLTA
jgi:hypothetical protein